MSDLHVQLLETRVQKRLNAALAGFEKGFASKAAQKRALDELNRAYEAIRSFTHSAVLSAADKLFPKGTDWNLAGRYEWIEARDLPIDLHQIRDRHAEVVETLAPAAYPLLTQVSDLRVAIKAAPIVAVERPAAAFETRRVAVEKSLREILEARKSRFARDLDAAVLFGGLQVRVNVHMVYPSKGEPYVRAFYFLRGRFTPLQEILALAEAFERKGEGR